MNTNIFIVMGFLLHLKCKAYYSKFLLFQVVSMDVVSSFRLKRGDKLSLEN